MRHHRILVFEKDTTEDGVDVLVPIEVPEDINATNVGEWLTTLQEYPDRHYTVMCVSDVRDYEIKERPKELYAESVDTAEPPEYDPRDYIKCR